MFTYSISNTMKTSLVYKIFVLFPIILLFDWVLMILIGCVTCFFGAGEEFVCGPYCHIGDTILGLTGILFIYLLYPDIVKYFNRNKNVKTAKS